ncbi:hypothetical protein EK21DRAFT_119403 [Setomelanomma holmii]|uniref:Uncharacterized protein n=1 Tax=Setomelanomma holmii TaxID=210430 RepID=A0A9P4GX29_9PLEO|nr:hypothetical protein EK21DRAFT_119403 [Setomelanomma holmii]
MYTALLLGAFFAASYAAPLSLNPATTINESNSWQPALGSKTTCNKESDKIIGFYIGPQSETVLNNACAAMMPTCAYPELHPDIMCIQTIDWPLNGTKKSVRSANVETRKRNKVSGWNVQFAVTPAPQPKESAGVFWTKQDCYGYFAHMLGTWEPEDCHTDKGFGIGNITVGGESSLKGTVFEVTIVPGN